MGENHPSLIHFQTSLSKLTAEKLESSPYLNALSVIKTIRETNKNLSDKFQTGNVFGFKAKRIQSFFKDRYDIQGLNQQDRFVILKTNLRNVMNMVPIDFEDFTLERSKVDCLQPMEILNC